MLSSDLTELIGFLPHFLFYLRRVSFHREVPGFSLSCLGVLPTSARRFCFVSFTAVVAG